MGTSGTTRGVPSRGEGQALAVAAAVNGETSTGTEDVVQLPAPIIRLSVCEKARTVTSVCTSGTLCTTSGADGIEGAPFGSFVDFVLDDGGNPVLLMNDMSMHTINIRDNVKTNSNGSAMVTLFAQLAGQGGQDMSRCSITGTIEQIPEDVEDMATIRMRYAINHAYADQVMDSPIFSFYRVKPSKIYYVGGFGVQSQWVPVEDYEEAQPDILAQEASSIIKRLNAESMDDLSLVAEHVLDVKNTEKILVTAVDRLGMDLRVTKRISKKKLLTDEFRIGFRIPVISVEDAKSEMLKIFQEAWEKGQGFSWADDDDAPGSDIPVIKVAEDSLGN
jgi:putative heme iron utilization protein